MLRFRFKLTKPSMSEKREKFILLFSINKRKLLKVTAIENICTYHRDLINKSNYFHFLSGIIRKSIKICPIY